MRRLKKKTKTRAVILTVTVTGLMAICLTLVIEDAAAVPTTLNGKIEIDPMLFKDIFLNEWTYNSLRDFLMEHPDWAESIAKYIIDNFDLADLLQHLTLEELQQLCEMFPGMESVLGPMLLGALGNFGDGTPTLEPGVNVPSVISSALGKIDNGQLGEDDPEIELFTVDSTYRGQAYIRSVSLGDYDPGTRQFLRAPEFDGTGYVIAPSLFPSAAASGVEPYTLTFHLGEHRDFGTLVGDVSASTYIDDEGVHQFDPDGENRVWLIDKDEYRVSFYPEFDFSRARINDTYVTRNERKYRKFVQENYLGISSTQEEMLQRFIDETGVATPEEAAAYLQKNFEYEYKAMDCPEGSDLVEYFLFTKKAGTCTNFASALTLLSRKLGVPARFVQGYADMLEKGTANSISSKDAHAWTEIYVEGVGWKRLDATPGEKVQEISYTVDPDGSTTSEDPLEGDDKKALLTISSPNNYSGDIYLRSHAFGDYDQSKLEFKLIDEAELPIQSSASFYKNFTTGTASYLNVSYATGFSPYGMLTVNYSDLTFDEGSIYSTYRYSGENEFTEIGDARFARLDDTFVQRFYSEVNFDYGGVPDSSYQAFLNENYPTDVPSGYAPAVDTYLSQTGLMTPEAIEESLRTKHIHDPSNSHNQVVDFLVGDHTGTNQVFATAMVMLCRRLGYHARYVEGYRHAGGLFANESVTLTEQNHYYWVEVYYPGHGWKKFDPTPEGKRGHLSTPAKMQIKDIRIPYDGQKHLPTLDDIEVTLSGSTTAYDDIAPGYETITFAEWRDSYMRPGDTATLRFHPSYGDGYDALGSYHLAGIKLLITDAWGNDVTALYTGLDTKDLGTECYLIIYDPSEASSEESYEIPEGDESAVTIWESSE